MAAAFGLALLAGCVAGWLASSLVVAAVNAAHDQEDDR